MDIPKDHKVHDTPSYYDELAKNTLELESLQHSNAFEAVMREYGVQSDITHVQTKPEKFRSADLPTEFPSAFFIPEQGDFTIVNASLQEQAGAWNLTCRLTINTTQYLVTAQEGVTQIQTPTPEGEAISRQFEGDFAKRLLSGFVLSSTESKGTGLPPALENLKNGSEFRQLEVLLQSLGELNGLTHKQTIAAFESDGIIPGPQEQSELDNMNRVLFLKFSEVESMTSSAVATSLELGWQLVPDATTRIGLNLKETSQGTASKLEVSGERQPVAGSLADFVLSKKLAGLLPPDETEHVPQFLSPELDKEEWAHAATTLMKTLEPLMREYEPLDD